MTSKIKEPKKPEYKKALFDAIKDFNISPLNSYRRWEPKELSLIKFRVKKYLKGGSSIYSHIKYLNIRIPYRSWENIRSKFNKLVRAARPDGL